MEMEFVWIPSGQHRGNRVIPTVGIEELNQAPGKRELAEKVMFSFQTQCTRGSVLIISLCLLSKSESSSVWRIRHVLAKNFCQSRSRWKIKSTFKSKATAVRLVSKNVCFRLGWVVFDKQRKKLFSCKWMQLDCRSLLLLRRPNN